MTTDRTTIRSRNRRHPVNDYIMKIVRWSSHQNQTTQSIYLSFGISCRLSFCRHTLTSNLPRTTFMTRLEIASKFVAKITTKSILCTAKMRFFIVVYICTPGLSRNCAHFSNNFQHIMQNSKQISRKCETRFIDLRERWSFGKRFIRLMNWIRCLMMWFWKDYRPISDQITQGEVILKIYFVSCLGDY